MFPIGQNTQALKACHLARHLFTRVFARLCHEFFLRQPLTELLFDLNLNGHPVAVPARHVRHVVPSEKLRLIDDVLENLI